MTFKTETPLYKPIRAILGLILAWIVPGAGHAFIGRPARGVIIFLTVGATFWAGIAMGGVMTVDSQGQKWWFAAEMLTGVHGLVGWQRETQQMKKLQEDIQLGMEQKIEKLKKGGDERRRDLTDANGQIAALQRDILAAKTHRQRETLRENLRNCTNDRNRIEDELLRIHSKLNSMPSDHVEKVLAKKGLALVAPMATVARAYAGVAGLLNLMCMFDVIMLALIGTVVTTEPSDQEDDRR